MKIIALCGAKGAGKSTAADYFVTKGYTRIAFGDPLKDIVSIMFDWDRELLSGDTFKSRNWREETDSFWSDKLDNQITPRMMLQRVGTELIRNNIHKNFWVIKMEQKISKLIDQNIDKIVISDLRFPNEYAYLKSIGAIILRINRDIFKDYHHESESYYKKFDAIEIDNNYEIEQLYGQLYKYV